MQKCNYCGIITKYNVDKCPYCGATSYTQIDAMDGKPYEVKDIKNMKFRSIPKPNMELAKSVVPMVLLGAFLFLMIIAVIFFMLAIIKGFFMNNSSGKDLILMLLTEVCLVISIILGIITFVKTKKGEFELLGTIPGYVFKIIWIPCLMIFGGADLFFLSLLLTIGVVIAMLGLVTASYWFTNAYMNYKNDKKAIEKYNSLIKNGMLIKNIKYTILPSTVPNLFKLKVEYTTSNGVTLNLVSPKEYSGHIDDKDVDLLIDKTDFGNYYIDLEIF